MVRLGLTCRQCHQTRSPTLYRHILSIAVSLSLLLAVNAGPTKETAYVYGTDAHGITRRLPVNRYPSLYTGDFGSCLDTDQNLFNFTKFDAAYYADNMTIVFHLDGTTNIKNESLMMHISVDAYGSSRFDMTFDPCFLNIYSLCPLNASVPITAWAMIPVGPQQVGGIPPIAFDMPDFEGSTKLQVFANSTRSEIGCVQAVMKNQNSFAQLDFVSPVLGFFAFVAIVASFVTAAYGVSVRHMRMHYAHSLSVLVVFETFQTIFFSGALSLDWPSICVAWWSNFAWSAGLIYAQRVVGAVEGFVNIGDLHAVGGGASEWTDVIHNGKGNGGSRSASTSLVDQIYNRTKSVSAVGFISRRATATSVHAHNTSNPYDYEWGGDPVTPGMPTPGGWSGFPGLLSGVKIPAQGALFVGLVWFAVAVGLVAASMVVLKMVLEILAKIHWIKKDRLGYLRCHWKRYLMFALLRTVLVAFFPVMTLAILQFSLLGLPSSAWTNPASMAVTTIVFLVYLIGVGTLVGYACLARIRGGKFLVERDELVMSWKTGMGWMSTHKQKQEADGKNKRVVEKNMPIGKPLCTISSVPRIKHINNDPGRPSVHLDQGYIKTFGWLSARYRRTRWWFFACHIAYLFVRATFLGGGIRNPIAQVCGLLALEVLALCATAVLGPFEGTRNMALAGWMLGITKILTTALSMAFLPQWQLGRIAATGVGVVIVVVQALLVFGVMILVLLSAVSSYMSVNRNRPSFYGADENDRSPRRDPSKQVFLPDWLEALRVGYYEGVENRARDDGWSKKKKKAGKKAKKKMGGAGNGDGKGDGGGIEDSSVMESSFSLVSIRRTPKYGDLVPPETTSYYDDTITACEEEDVTDGARYELQPVQIPAPLALDLPAHDQRRRQNRSLYNRTSPLSPATGGRVTTIPQTPTAAAAKRATSTQSARLSGGGMGTGGLLPAISRPGSPFGGSWVAGLTTPSRETLARYAEERVKVGGFRDSSGNSPAATGPQDHGRRESE